MASPRRVRIGPRGPVLLLSVMVLAAVASLVTSVVDVLIPVLTGEPPFGLLFSLERELGPRYLFFHIFLHNLGLACLVPGLGFLAGRFEREKANRRRIAAILLGCVVLALASNLEYLFQAGWVFTAPILLALASVEALAVLALAVAAYKPVRDYVPTRAIGWSLVAPMNRLAAWFLVSGLTLAASAWYEVTILL